MSQNTHKIIKYVSPVNHDGDERLELGSLDLAEIPRGLVDEGVEELQKVLIGLRHHLPVVLGLFESLLRVPRPDHL